MLRSHSQKPVTARYASIVSERANSVSVLSQSSNALSSGTNLKDYLAKHPTQLKMLGFGSNKNGELGVGKATQMIKQPTPIKSTHVSKCIPQKLAVGPDHTLMQTGNGLLVCGSSGASGQMDRENSFKRFSQSRFKPIH